MTLSKSKIDKAGRFLCSPGELSLDSIELEYAFDEYRGSHLGPLSKTTLELQQWLHEYGGKYYIAQRLKRKPQIIRKLKRLSVRLSQLQDIGGCRIIVGTNDDVDSLVHFIKGFWGKDFKLKRFTDYRQMGRDITGYRAVHIMIEVEGRTVELQIRSRIQHYWSETIERTSVIYGHHLKEQEGDPIIIAYFKNLSDSFFKIENGKNLTAKEEAALEDLREQSEEIIYQADNNKVFDSFVNEDIVRTLDSVQGNTGNLNNWIIVFDWSRGSFLTWESVGRDTSEAVQKYTQYEKQFPAEENYEVVMIGSSDIATVRQTHSHYFGIDRLGNILENFTDSVVGFQTRMDIDIGSRQILGLLVRKNFWGKKATSIDTLKNHLAKGIITFDSSLETLRKKGLINMQDSQSPISLNLKKKSEIEGYL